MADEQTRAEIYHLKGPGIELSYRRSANKLDIAGDEHLLTQDDLDAHTASASEAGLHITATLLQSSRNGTKVVLILLLPDVSTMAAGHEPIAVTGVAVVTRSFKDVVGGPPPVLQSYDDVRRLEGTVSPAD